MGECEVSGEAGEGGGAPTKQAAPPHTRQDAEADFLGGLIGGGEALSHSQKAMEFCRLRQPSTCQGGGHHPRPEHRTHEQEKTETKKKRNGDKNTEGSMQMKKERMKQHQEENAKTTNLVNGQQKKTQNMAG